MKSLFFSLSLMLFCILPACTSQQQIQTQKNIVTTIVGSGIVLAKTNIAERKLALKQVGNSDLFEAADKIGRYKVVKTDSGLVLFAAPNWEHIQDLVLEKCYDAIDKGLFVIDFGNGKNRQPQDTTKLTLPNK